MPQIHPNFTQSDANAASAAPIQAGRFTITNPSQTVPVTFGKAFADTNYTLLLTVEQDTPYILPSIQISARSTTGFSLYFANAAQQGVPITIHFVAIHD